MFLPGAALGLGLALSCLAVDVLSGCRLEGSLLFGQVGGLDERLVKELLLAEDTANGLVVSELGDLEQDGVKNSRRGLLIRLLIVSHVVHCAE